MTLGRNEMESEVMEDDAPIGQTTKWKVAWEQVSEVVNGFQVLEYLRKIVVPSRNTRRDKYTNSKIKWTSKLSLLSQTTAVNKSIYQQGIKLITADLTTQCFKDLLRNEAQNM